MKNTKLYLALVGCFAASAMLAPLAHADATSDLKAELASQRALLEALEKKLEATTHAASEAKAAAQKVADSSSSFSHTPGEGLTYQSGKDSVTLYGLLDLTATSVSNSDASGNRLTTFQTPWFSGSRWGLKGKRQVQDDGLSVIFTLESEFVLKDGSMDTPGVLFNRDAWVGFESDGLGKLTFGRQNALARDFSQNYGDPYGTANVKLDEGGWTNTNNFKQLIFYAGSASGTRMDNGIVWKKNLDANWVAGLAHQLGNTASDSSRGTTTSAALAYNGKGFDISGYATHADVNGFDHNSYSLGGNVQFNPLVRVNAGYFHYTADQATVGERKDNAWTLSTKLTPAGSFDYELGYQVMKADNAGYSGSGNTLNAFNSTSSVTASGSGEKKTVYGSVFYHLDKRSELYVAADYMRLNGGYKVGATNGFNSQSELGLGVRTRF
ncbi:MAG TPA: porin [Rhodocyclaceae bacterium]